MIEIFYYIVFVIVPIFIIGFQAILLPVFFLLKAWGLTSRRAFICGGIVTGVGFGYVYAKLSSIASPWMACLVVAVFGAASAAFWFRALGRPIKQQ
tara:strand:+ start:1600 stop:1887 length:288 start_codon:yes stop_codon:yes gene_type:complete